MKRSEMVKILQDSFLYYMNSPEPGFPNNDEELYSAVLQDLEDAGMVPPFSYKMFYNDFQRTRDIVDSIGNDWEPE